MTAPTRTSASLPLAGLCVLFALLIACRPSGEDVAPSQDYFPLRIGQRWVYDTTFYGPSVQQTTTEVAVCRIQESSGGGDFFLVASCDDQSLIQVEVVLREDGEIVVPVVFDGDGTARPRTPAEVVAFSEPKIGTRWAWQGSVDEDPRASIYEVTGRGRVFTPAGGFDAMRLLVVDLSVQPIPAAVERWYSPGVGLVKEAGQIIIPAPNGFTRMELVRTLREHGMVDARTLPCCTRVPAEATDQ